MAWLCKEHKGVYRLLVIEWKDMEKGCWLSTILVRAKLAQNRRAAEQMVAGGHIRIAYFSDFDEWLLSTKSRKKVVSLVMESEHIDRDYPGLGFFIWNANVICAPWKVVNSRVVPDRVAILKLKAKTEDDGGNGTDA